MKKNNGSWDYKESPTTKLQMLDYNATLVSLQKIKHNVAMKTLGVCLSTDGNEKRQIEELRKTEETWNQKIKKTT